MQPRVCLSVGAGTHRGLPCHYRNFDVVTLDVDPETAPDIVADVRDLSSIEDESFDAVFMAHLLEHFERHELTVVMNEVARVLKPGGFAEIRVPHVQAAFEAIVDGKDIDEPLYDSAMGPINALDMIFGHGRSLADGDGAMAHRTAFTPGLLERVLQGSGLRIELLQPTDGVRFELCGIARKVGEGFLEFHEAEEALAQAEAESNRLVM